MYLIPIRIITLEDMNVKTVTSPPPPEEVGGDGFMLTDDESSPRPRSVSAKSTRPVLGRSKSMANLLLEVERQKKSFSLLTMVPDVRSSAIEEEHDEENPGAIDALALAPSDLCLDKSLYKGQQLLDVQPTNDLTNSANRRPSRRAGLDRSLTSSLRRSFSLRTSQTSLTSSNLFEDWSQHSMKRNVSQAPSSTSGTDSSIVSGSGLERTEDDRAYIKSVLRQDVLFQDVVREGSQTDLASSFDRVEYKKGDVIFSQGDTGKDFMLILKEGECSITIDGEEVSGNYGTMRPPAMVGELALLMDRERAATVMAKTNVVAFRLDRASFKYFIVKSEDVKADIRKIDHVIDKISGIKSRYGGDIIRQFKPNRRWLWGQWHGTIFQQAWKTAVAFMLVSACFVAAVRSLCHPTWALGQIPDPNFPFVSKLAPLANLWQYLMTISTFILTFFLSQAYTLWRNMYDNTRKIQGRINDIGLLVASTVERDDEGKFTKRGEDLLDDIANYTCLFHVFCWAKYSKKFQVLSTSRGMSRMLSRGIMSRTEYSTLTSLRSSNHGTQYACLSWILVKCQTAMKDKTLPNDHALREVLFQKICDLRGTYHDIGDQLDGRIPLAYAHFVQVLVDSFLFIAPFALYPILGIWSIATVGLLTLFYAGLLDLSKILLDPLDNDNDESYDSPVNVDIGVLIRESNSTRWKYSAEMLPFATTLKAE